MNKIFAHQTGKRVLVYLDDILVYSKMQEDHIRHLRDVCHFNNTQTKYLGHLISSNGARLDPNNVEKVKEWPRLTSIQEVRSFLDLTNYFRKFMQ